MAITVKDIKEKDFTAEKHGYSIEEVDDFLDQIADELSELLRENMSLKQKLTEAQSAPQTAQTVVVESEPRTYDDQGYFKNLESAMRETLINAQRLAEETRANAEREAAQTVSSARENAAAITAAAQAEVDTCKAEAQKLRTAATQYRADFRKLLEEQMASLKSRETLFD